MSENVFVRGESDSSFEAMTKEEVITAIVNAIEGGTVGDIDTGFVTTIKEQNKGQGLMFWVGTTAEYNALTTKPNNVLYIKTDDTSAQDINNNFEALQASIDQINDSMADSGWVALTGANGWDVSNAQCRKVGNHVFVRGYITPGTISSLTVAAEFPEGFAPSSEAYLTAYASGAEAPGTTNEMIAKIICGKDPGGTGVIQIDAVVNLLTNSTVTSGVNFIAVEFDFFTD
jgi:hypothetical protein